MCTKYELYKAYSLLGGGLHKLSTGKRNSVFFRISGNARFMIVTHPLWAIPFFMVNSYASLYMIGRGLSERDVGTISSLSFIAKAVAAVFAAYIVNRLGRKLSNVLTDIFCWVIPYAIWAFATNYTQFLIASALNAVVIISSVGWHCFLVEDVDPKDRIFVYNMIEIMTILSGFVVPVTGYLIDRYTLVPAVSYLYIFAFACMFVVVILKSIFLKETTAGKKRIDESKNSSSSTFSTFIKAPVYILKNKTLTILLALSIAANFCYNIYSLFYFPYLTKHLKYNDAGISVFPLITSFIALLMMLFIVPRIKSNRLFLFIGLFMNVAGGAFLVITPFKNSIILIVINVLCWAISKSLVNIILQAETANSIDDHIRADIVGFSNIFSMICMIPAGTIGGMLFGIHPINPFYFTLVIYLCMFLLFALSIMRSRSIAADNENVDIQL